MKARPLKSKISGMPFSLKVTGSGERQITEVKSQFQKLGCKLDCRVDGLGIQWLVED